MDEIIGLTPDTVKGIEVTQRRFYKMREEQRRRAEEDAKYAFIGLCIIIAIVAAIATVVYGAAQPPAMYIRERACIEELKPDMMSYPGVGPNPLKWKPPGDNCAKYETTLRINPEYLEWAEQNGSY